jgi:xylitol oxidase
VRQHVYENLPVTQIEDAFDAIFSSGYSVSLFTDWRREYVNQLWLKQKMADETAAHEAAPTLFGATLAPADRHPIAEISAENCTPQMGVAGPWHERLPHFRMEYTPSSGQELQSEYFVPRENGAKAFRAIAALRDRISPHLFISEIRTVAADSLWMSPCYQQACVGIHFTWKPEWSAVQKLLPLIEEQLAPFNVRPHWGKLFTMAPARLRSVYKRVADFQELLRSYDSRGKFSNVFLETYILDRH